MGPFLGQAIRPAQGKERTKQIQKKNARIPSVKKKRKNHQKKGEKEDWEEERRSPSLKPYRKNFTLRQLAQKNSSAAGQQARPHLSEGKATQSKLKQVRSEKRLFP